MNHQAVQRSPQVTFLLELYAEALSAANPFKVVPPHLPHLPKGRTVVVGAGKAAAAMACAVESHWVGPLSGVVVVPEGAVLKTTRIRVHEASHPVPDQRSLMGARLLMAAVDNLSEDDLVIALISGGGSSLCALPADGLALEDKQRITRELLRRGASIDEINTVRRHLSAIKGGRLAAQAYPARVVTLVISDIPGDDPALVASGPTLPDPTSCRDALLVLQRYGIDDNPLVRDSLVSGAWESVPPGADCFARNTHVVIASALDGLNAAARLSRERGVSCHVLSDAMEGESRDLAQAHAAIALSVAQHNTPFAQPCVILSGGEATVTVRGSGRGGRNTEFVLALALALEGKKGAEFIHALSAGTDGLDGLARAAGAWAMPGLIGRLQALGLNARASLESNDSASALEAAGSLIHTGATHTNINDFRALFVGSA